MTNSAMAALLVAARAPAAVSLRIPAVPRAACRAPADVGCRIRHGVGSTLHCLDSALLWPVSSCVLLSRAHGTT